MLRKFVPFVLCLLASWFVSSAAPAPEITFVKAIAFYDQSAVDLLGSPAAIEDEIEMAFAQTNEAFVNSGGLIRITPKIMGFVPPDVEKAGSAGDQWKMKADLLRSRTVAAIRDKEDASLVLWVSDLVFVGAGSRPRTRAGFWEPTHGYSVVPAGSAFQSKVLAHEIGHSFGMDHDPAHVPPSLGKDQYRYARGYVAPDGTCDIMSYDCHRQILFSGRNVVQNGIRYGSPTADNIRVANANRWLVQAWGKMKYKPKAQR